MDRRLPAVVRLCLGLVCLALLNVAPVQAATCAAAWNCNTSYGTGAQASFGGHNYTMAYSRAASCPGFNPSVDNWWTDNGVCGGAATPTATPTGATPTPTANPSSTPRPTSTATATNPPTATPTATPTGTSSGGLSCSGVPVFAICTAYATGTNVQYNGTLYQALAPISTTRDCPPTAPNNPANDNWWSNLGKCASGTTPTPTPTSMSGPGATNGTINYHLILGQTTATESLTLDGGNYNDLIMSNVIAGVMLGHMIQEGFPGIQYNKPYMYASIMGQLLQENIETVLYQSSTNLLDPAPEQQGVMTAGQGGPYQINNYVPDMVAGGATPEGHALVNYIAIQKNIGFTIATASAQLSKVTPPSFNNKYYGPMLPAYFHYNDMVALHVIPGTLPWQPAFEKMLTNFLTLPDAFLDMVLNVAYNAGYYNGLFVSYATQGSTATPATVATIGSYTSAYSAATTFGQYPYQVRYYADQMYDNPVPASNASPTPLVTPTNHIAFAMPTLANVFSNVFQLMSYSNGTSPGQFFTASQAQAAFNSALSQQGVSSTAVLDLSTAADRTKIFAVIDSAIGNLESAVGMKFNATTTSQL